MAEKVLKIIIFLENLAAFSIEEMQGKSAEICVANAPTTEACMQAQCWHIYAIMIKHQLSIYTSMNHSLLSLKLLALALNFLDTLSEIRIKVFTLLF